MALIIQFRHFRAHMLLPKDRLWVFFSYPKSLVVHAARCGVSISLYPTMARARNTKKAKVTVVKPRGKKHGASSSNLVVFVPTKTRRGKIRYTEADGAPYYKLSDEESEPPKMKPSEPLPASQEDMFQWEASFLDDQEPHTPRITKVRL